MTSASAPTAGFHAATGEETLAALSAGREGLSAEQAAERLAEHGPNRLPAAKPVHPLIRFLKHFNNVLIYILLIAGLIKAIYQDWVDVAVIVAVAVINALIGFLQEGQAEKALAGIRGMLSLHAEARRDGRWQHVEADELVPGDIVRLGAGDKVPADVRLLEVSRLAIDESPLTGESVPSSKQIDPVDADAGVGDRADIAHSGTVVARGTGLGVVVATGRNAEIGRIQALAEGVSDTGTPLTAQLDRLGTQFSIGILVASAVMMLIGRFLHQMAAEDLLSAVISFAVAMVPEGLPPLVTITLALGVQQMARHRAITRTMTAVETLGAVTTICSDKTGTLTRNEMTARVVRTPSDVFDVTGDGYARAGALVPRGGDGRDAAIARELGALVDAIGLCNDAVLREQGEIWEIVGEPTEAALAIVARKAGFGASSSRRLAVLPFDSAYKYMAVLEESDARGTEILVKGAPDRLLERCTRQSGGGGFDRARWEAAITELASQGMRVLAAARRPAPVGATEVGHEDVEEGLEFLGLVGLVDPPRQEAIAAIASCRQAGIAVKMITGDHAETARAISRDLALSSRADPVVLTGAEVEGMSKDRLVQAVAEVDVFARTSPEHKIRIVDALQARREVVAMTGDGVNDAPALIRADIGVAMGIKGTEATKEAADMVLADDNFATIERAVAEGRRIYDNIRKSVVFLLPTTIGQGIIVLAAVLFGFTAPLEPTQILWVNLVTAVTLSIALAYEPAEKGIMRRAPRDRDAQILDSGLWLRVAWMSALIGGGTIAAFFLMQSRGASPEVARSLAVAVLVVSQIVVLFNSRFLRLSSLHPRAVTGNPVIWLSVGALLVLQLLFTYLPAMNDWFGSAPLGPAEWGLTAIVAIAVFLLVEAQKALAGRMGSRARADGAVAGRPNL
jgi:magnesium-transporting ATPase (P-type)